MEERNSALKIVTAVIYFIRASVDENGFFKT
jgi:hypothetical protein